METHRAPSVHLMTWVVLALVACGGAEEVPGSDGPNVLFVFVDDMGYGDLGIYGSDTIETPHLDALAADGVRFTQFYAGNAVCTPSRAILMTGRQGPRQVLSGTLGGVYFPGAPYGMDVAQVTIADVLHGAGYATSLVGKWHLGDQPEFLPTRQGFDYFWGLPYSNDMTPLRLMENEIELKKMPELSDQETLTQQYTEQIVTQMRAATEAEKPFFIYYANNFPHVPLAASAEFAGRSPSCDDLGVEQACGLYADVVSELDASVGTLLDELDALGIRDDTLVVFTSDNGPWLSKGRDGGSAGPFHQGKSTTYEGGFRVPAIASLPSRFRRGVVEEAPATMMDWMPTLAALAGASLPADHVYDGHDLGPLLRGEGARDPSGRPFEFAYYRFDNKSAGAFRQGKWKYKAPVDGGEAVYVSYTHGELLFDLDADPGEQNDLASQNPDKLAELRDAMQARDAAIKADPHR